MKCNYDSWTTPLPKSVTPKMRDVLKVMRDGRERNRPDMLRAAGIEPNPKTEMGYPGNERTDYYLYKMELIELVGVDGPSKVFRITMKGLKAIS